MTEIITAIDAWTANRYAYTKKLYGFSELVKKSSSEGKEDIFPMTIPGNPSSRREKVSLDDRYTFITWIRWAQPATYSASEDWSFGKSEARIGEIPLRLILAHKTILGEDVVFDFINAFPSKFTVSGFQFVFINGSPSIDPDHDTIMQTELNGTNYEKHRFDWNVYVLNINIQFLECLELTP
jgi:hypothetical protein